jgi:hypothetical protein
MPEKPVAKLEALTVRNMYPFYGELCKDRPHPPFRKETPMAMPTVSRPTIDRAIEECLQSLRWCSACVDEGLTHDLSKMAESVRLCHECGPICGVCATLLSQNSRFAHQFCGVCADTCEACAVECGKHDHVETMRKCAEACLRCAKTCRQIAESGPIRTAA